MGMVRFALLLAVGLGVAGCGDGAASVKESQTLSESPIVSSVGASSPSPDPSSSFPPASECPVVAPVQLPDGVAAGPANPPRDRESATFMGSWGEDSNRVTIGRGREVLEQAEPATFPRPGEPVVGEDGTKRWVIAVGDPPLGMIQYRFVVGGCPYILWTESGLTWDEALIYASHLRTLTGKRLSIRSHCGVVSVWVGKALWLADPRLGGHHPPAGWDENQTLGYFFVTGPGRATFVGDGGQVAHFGLAATGTEDPLVGCE